MNTSKHLFLPFNMILVVIKVEAINGSSLTGGLDCLRMKNFLEVLRQNKGNHLNHAENLLLEVMTECNRLASRQNAAPMVSDDSLKRSKRESQEQFTHQERTIFISDMIWKLKVKSCVFVTGMSGT